MFRRALVIGLALAASHAAHAEPCAAILGERVLVAAVRSTLDARGVADAPACEPVTVRIARSDAGITVAIEDAYGRTSERVVADAIAAATVVESWTRTDELAMLLAVTPPRRSRVAARNDDELPAILHREPATPPPLPVGGIALGFESTLGSDRSQWLGMRGGACITFGITCVGVLLRVASNVSDPTIEHYGVDLLVGADVTLRLGRVQLVPGAAIGLGWIHSVQIAQEMFGFPQPDFDAAGLRADLHLGVILPLGHGLALELATSLDLSVRADARTYPANVAELVAEPRGFLRTSLGLRYGAP